MAQGVLKAVAVEHFAARMAWNLAPGKPLRRGVVKVAIKAPGSPIALISQQRSHIVPHRTRMQTLE